MPEKGQQQQLFRKGSNNLSLPLARSKPKLSNKDNETSVCKNRILTRPNRSFIVDYEVVSESRGGLSKKDFVVAILMLLPKKFCKLLNKKIWLFFSNPMSRERNDATTNICSEQLH